MLNRRIAVRAAVLMMAVLSSAALCAVTASKAKTVDPWSVLRGYSIGSVAWSPKGDHIAFVAARWKDDTDTGVSRDSIWLLSLPRNGVGQAKLRHLVTLVHEEHGGGIAAGLFWLNDGTLGWVTQGGDKYTFMQMGLDDTKPKQLVKDSFAGSECSDCMSGDTPGDVYYDSGSDTLLFAAHMTDGSSYVKMLPLCTKKVRTLSVRHPVGLSDPVGYLDAVTVCGSLRDPQKPVFYLSAFAGVQDDKHTGNGWYLWRSDSYALGQDRIIVGPSSTPFILMWYPRISPKGSLLAMIRYIGEGSREIAVCDVASGRVKTLAKPADPQDSLTSGCPYSWSPDGKQIAYSDGSRIRIVRVDPK